MIVQIIGAFLAVVAFSIMLEVPKRFLLAAGIVGAVGWTAYLSAVEITENVVFSTFISAVVIAFVCQFLARSYKAPVTVFLIAGILPLVPGLGMYYIVYYNITGNRELSSFYFSQTLQIAGIIAVAIFVVDSIFRVLNKFRK